MKNIVFDFETYYSKDYTLRNMTPVEYILDPRFESIGCAIKEGLNAKTYWVDGEDLPRWFKQADRNAASISHNALFDACIMAWRYDYVPKLIIDTLGVSRAVLGAKLKSLALKSVARYLGLGEKGDTVQKVVGMCRDAIKQSGFYEEYKVYSCNDADLCAGIFEELVVKGLFPLSELAVMDNVLRCAVEPKFILDQNVLAEHLQEIRSEKDTLLARAMLVGADGKSDLMSNDKFAALLRGLGVEPPMKISPVTNRQSYAFAKTDPAFMDLLEHDNPGVQAIVGARLGHKSTLAETRATRLMDISNLTWEGNDVQQLIPMPLKFSGAHTHRISGDWKLNMQNLPRGGALRRALKAPRGCAVFAVDSSQIEARIVAWLCGVGELTDAFERGIDVYSMFASEIFGYPVNKKQHPIERFVGKTGILGLGYGVGALKFQTTVKLQSKAQLGQEVELPDDQAAGVVATYRSRYWQIPTMWRALNSHIEILANGGKEVTVGPCVIRQGEIEGPSGLKLYYPDLQRDSENNWQFKFGNLTKRLYGGALLENIVQHLARLIVMDAGVRIRKRMMPFALQVHDELVYVVPEELFDQLRKVAIEEMSRRPVWAPGLPVACEGNSRPAANYADAK